jgi:DNA-directed RNA polymerase subunit L
MTEIEAKFYSERTKSGEASFIKRSPNGLYVDKRKIHEGLSGPFQMLADYGHGLETLKKETAFGYHPEGITDFSGDPTVLEATSNLTMLARIADMQGVIDDPNFGVLYSANFTLGFVTPFDAAVESMEGEDWTLLSPLRGGEVVHEIAGALGYEQNHPLFRGSRVILDDGRYLVGIQVGDENVDIRENIVFADDCQAAAGSMDATLHWASNANGGIKRMAVAVGVAVKRSAEAISRSWQRESDKAFYFTGALANGLTDKYYIRVTEEELRKGLFPENCWFRVGDMGGAMSLTGKRGEQIRPVIRAVARGLIPADKVFEATNKVILNPELLGEESKKLQVIVN